MAEDSNNMEIARYHRQVKQDPSAGNFIATPSNTYAADQQLFNTITQTALAIEAVDEKIRVAEANDQLASASIQSDQAFEELRNSLDPNNTEDWAEKEGEFYKTRLEEIGGQIKNKYARDEWPLRVEAKKAQYGRILGSQKRSVLARNFQENHRNMSASAMAISWEMPDYQEFNIFTADKMEVLHGLQLKEGSEGDRELKIENFERVDEEKENPMFPDEKLRFSSGEIYLEGSKKGFNKKQVENFKDFMVETALKSDDGMEMLNLLRAEDGKDIGLTNDDLDDIKRDYKTKKNYAKSVAIEQLIKHQQEIEKGFDLRFADPDMSKWPSVDEINTAYANDDIDQTAWKGFNKRQSEGAVEVDDDEAKMRVNEVRKQIMDGEITARKGLDEIRPYKDKLTASTYKTLTDGLPQLYEMPAHAKPYYGYIDTFMKDTKPSSDTHFNPLGETTAERALNGNRITSILDEFRKNNPDASYSDWDKEYKRATETIVKNQVGSWWSRWIETSISIRNLKKYSKPGSSVKQMLKDKKASETSEYKSGDKRIVNGVTYTYDGQYWKD